jgi:hypothetical protein
LKGANLPQHFLGWTMGHNKWLNVKAETVKLNLANEAEVPKAKIVLYLLNQEHRRGKSKARFFVSRGFDVEHWQNMASVLRRHAAENEIVKEETTPLGVRTVVEGAMAMPNGTLAEVRSIWFIECGERIPRFVTAYPLKKKAAV